MTASPNTTQAPAATETKETGLRLVAAGETEPTLAEKIESFAALVVENERAAAELKAEAAKFAAQADTYKVELRKLLDIGTHTVGNLKVTLTKPSRSFDGESFMKAYPVELNPALYKSVINNEALPPALKNQFMAAGTGDPKVSVK